MDYWVEVGDEFPDVDRVNSRTGLTVRVLLTLLTGVPVRGSERDRLPYCRGLRGTVGKGRRTE